MRFIKNDVLLTSEAIELLGITRARLHSWMTSGKITACKSSGATSLLLRGDLIEKKKELIALRRSSTMGA
ncbi:DNA-binding protein [Peribacillus sp. NPDC097895]|uniref:DNA-binding protein n=1 Tax=Peribacillus sp. NPDC097895 TaxID=3390619 RepID=UPI003CFDC76B